METKNRQRNIGHEVYLESNHNTVKLVCLMCHSVAVTEERKSPILCYSKICHFRPHRTNGLGESMEDPDHVQVYQW